MSLVAKEESKWVVVIPEGGLSWHLWCIDFICNSSSSQDIIVLDLRDFSLRGKNAHLARFLRGFYRRNTVDVILQRAINSISVEYVRPRESLSTNLATEEFHITNSVSFKNGLDSEYFEEAGERILKESQLNAKTLSRAKKVYDDVSGVIFQLLQSRKVSRLIIPGGRTLIPAACIAIAKTLGVQATILESNNNSGFGYRENPTNYRSNTDFLKSEMDSKWSNGDVLKYGVARKYLEDKLGRVNTDGTNYSHSFDLIYNLPSDEGEKTAVIFVTSAYEFESFVGSHLPGDLGRDHQFQIVQTFCRIAKQAGFHLFLRGHPPISGRESLFAMEDLEWADFCYRNEITYLDSNSKVDSQHLMKQASLNVVYASSAAIESILLGSQTLILGNTEFAHLVPELCAFDAREIERRLANLERETEAAQLYPYAYFMSGHGTEIPGVTISDRNLVYFNGKQVDAPRFAILEKFRRKYNRQSVR
jgi:hypothetical protein